MFHIPIIALIDELCPMTGSEAEKKGRSNSVPRRSCGFRPHGALGVRCGEKILWRRSGGALRQ